MVKLHVDKQDYAQVSVIAWQQLGDVHGGPFVIPDLGVHVPIRQGTVVFLRSGELIHGTAAGAKFRQVSPSL